MADLTANNLAEIKNMCPIATKFDLQTRIRKVATAAAYTQTYATAGKTHAADGSTDVAAADSAAAAAATSTAITTAIPAASPAGGTGAAAGAWDTAANRDAAIATINGLRDDIVEIKTDHDALLADVADIRAKYAAVVTLANENKADFNLLRATVTNSKQLANAIIDDLQANGSVG